MQCTQLHVLENKKGIFQWAASNTPGKRMAQQEGPDPTGIPRGAGWLGVQMGPIKALPVSTGRLFRQALISAGQVTGSGTGVQGVWWKDI